VVRCAAPSAVDRDEDVEALMTAMAGCPFASFSSSTASLLIGAVTTMPPISNWRAQHGPKTAAVPAPLRRKDATAARR